jgi:hypothetical protein
MNEQIVYSVFKNGSDAAGIVALIEILTLGGIFIYLAIHFRNAKRSGKVLISSSSRTTQIWNFLADHATPVIVTICCVGFVLTFQAWNLYRADLNALASGNYQTLVGTLGVYRIADATQYRHSRSLLDGVPGFNSSFLEKDAIVLNGRTFYIACNRTIDGDLPAIGNEGRCLALHAGQQIRIDFIQNPDGSYRTEPLRISVVR